MSGPSFFQTAMGRRFYEHTMPAPVKQLERLNDALDALLVTWAKETLRKGRKQ